MTVAAIALALALLLGPAPAVVRARAGIVPAPRPHRRGAAPPSDPLAVASSLDVFAVCLSAGMAVPAAARATAPSAPGELAAVLGRAAHLLALGGDAEAAWSLPPGAPPLQAEEQITALLRLARRSASSGAVLADGVAELAARCRVDAGHRAAAAAERASVVIAGPLGLCFLPAFVCVGVIPVVVGLASDVLGSGLL